MMARKMISVLIAAFLLCSNFLPGTSVSAAAHAEAEDKDPDIRIGSREEFRRFAENCALDSWSEGIVVSLEIDLDFGGEDIAPIPSFSGIFLGNGHRIDGMTLSTDGSNQALFRHVTKEAVVRELNVKGEVSPENGRDYIGGIAGTNWGTIENCSFSGRISGKNYIGGIVGDNHGTITGCSFSGTVDGKRFSGGIAGYSEGLIRDCRNSGEVNILVSEEKLNLTDLATSTTGLALNLLSAEDENIVSDSGGVVGFSKGVVLNCSNTGTVGYPHYGYNVGGIAGRQSGYLSGCNNMGTVFGKKDVAGVVGQMEPHLALVDSANLADELLVLNKYMNNASADIAALAEDFRDLQDEMESERISGGTVHSGGSIYHANETIPADINQNADSGAISDSTGSTGTISGIVDSDQTQGTIDSAKEAIENRTDGQITGSDIDTAARKTRDYFEARFNELSFRLAEAYDVFSESGGSLAYDLNMANNQFSRVMLLMANAMNGAAQNDLFTDVSDSLGEDVTEGNVKGNTNHAIVEGDNNVGGIAGSMGIEYEFDLEDSLAQIVGANGIISNTYNSTCISSENVNFGKVTGKKDCVGGIVGSEETGTVIRCESYGAAGSTEGSYVGGIAGHSDTSVRQSYAMCMVSGTRYVGGIVGSGKDLYDNTSIIDTDASGAFVGAVAGWADMNTGDNIKGNRFVHSSLGGVDGISYTGRAEPIQYEELLVQKEVPAGIRQVTVSFYADGILVRELTLDYGADLEASQLPAVPSRAGYTGSWGEFEMENIRFSRDIEAVYTLNRSTLASTETREDTPQSLVLLEGSFEDGAELVLQLYEGEGPDIPESSTQERWELRLKNTEQNDGTYMVRYLPDSQNSETTIYVLKGDEWVPVETETSGSYLVFQADGNPIIFSAASADISKAFPVLPVAAGAGAVLLLAVVLAAVHKHRKKKMAEQPKQS